MNSSDEHIPPPLRPFRLPLKVKSKYADIGTFGLHHRTVGVEFLRGEGNEALSKIGACRVYCLPSHIESPRRGRRAGQRSDGGITIIDHDIVKPDTK